MMRCGAARIEMAITNRLLPSEVYYAIVFASQREAKLWSEAEGFRYPFGKTTGNFFNSAHARSLINNSHPQFGVRLG